ncbi:hypothetical protein [Verrucomicrobium spinosum]|uniref:hypothetical protein n=1 Tax=Verrucomicrobium spinosum TaxID=2736 RepID=UPI0001744B34|nr:hypothetical protein [Verrucomicrobium spinosum]
MTSLAPRSPAWRSTAGFSLLETSAAMGILLALALAMLAMLQQHIVFMNLARQQGFLTTDAPQVGNLVGRLFAKADHYFVYENRAGALAGAPAVLSNGKAARLFFEAANGETREQWITAETSGGSTSLVCRSRRADGSEFSWNICTGLAGANFRCDEGVLGVTLKGAGGEEISYYGGSQ